MVDTCHYTLLQTTDHTAPRVSPNVNPVLQEIMTCQCDFSDYNECPTPGVLIVAEALRVRVCVCGGAGTLSREYMGHLWTFSSILLWTEDCSKNIFKMVKMRKFTLCIFYFHKKKCS